MGGILFGTMPILEVVLAPLILAGAFAVSTRAPAKAPVPATPSPQPQG